MVAEKIILPQIRSTIQSVRDFRARWQNQLPNLALGCVDRFLESIKNFDGHKDHLGIRSLLSPVVTFRAEFEYCIVDRSIIARSLAERAFSHLNRLLIASRSMRDEWLRAFREEREEACERLGAVHLLLHGIWAFKANAADSAGRTDLVLGLPMASTDEAERSAEALVLTEWKKVVDGDDPEARATEALEQARIYAGGVLGGVELRSTRYLVLVSEDISARVSDRIVDDVTYRVVQVAINPSPPSELARRAK